MPQLLAMDEAFEREEAEAARLEEERLKRGRAEAAEAARRKERAERAEALRAGALRRADGLEAKAAALPRVSPEALAQATARERGAEESAARLSLAATMALHDHLGKAPEGLSGFLRGLVGLNFLWRRGRARLEAAQERERAKLQAAARQREEAEKRERRRLERAEREAAPERAALGAEAVVWRYAAEKSTDEGVSAAMGRGDDGALAHRLAALCGAENHQRAQEAPPGPEDGAGRAHAAYARLLEERRIAEARKRSARAREAAEQEARRLTREQADRDSERERQSARDNDRGYGD